MRGKPGQRSSLCFSPEKHQGGSTGLGLGSLNKFRRNCSQVPGTWPQTDQAKETVASCVRHQ